MRSFSRAAAAFATGLAVLLSACAADGVEPRVWADRVCQALAPWTEEIATLTSDAQRQMSRAETPRQAKDAIVSLLRGAEDASEHAREGIVAAGTPAVDNGDKIARQFATALRGARNSYRKARRAVEKLTVDDTKAFYDGTVAVMDKLNKNYQDSGLDTDKLSSDELQQAFDEAPECR